jgi:hypothetical protein
VNQVRPHCEVEEREVFEGILSRLDQVNLPHNVYP